MARWYVGKHSGGHTPFSSANKPTYASHGAKYSYVVGPFKTRGGAHAYAKAGGNMTQKMAENAASLRVRKAESEILEEMQADLNRALATAAAAPGGSMAVGSRRTSSGRAHGLTPTMAGSPAAARESAKPAKGELTHEEAQATRGTLGKLAHGAAAGAKKIGAAVAAGARSMATSKSVECPHCGEGLSREYVVKALSILAKSEGLDLDEELESLLSDESVVKSKGKKKGMAAELGNRMDDHRGPHKAGKMHHSSRGRGDGPGVQRGGPRPKNPTVEDGMSKSFPVIIGQPQLVEYVMGADDTIAKGIQDGSHQVQTSRNLRMEQGADIENG